MNRIGLKLWSTNTDFYLKSAVELYKNQIFDYIELYVVPNSFEHLPKWEKMQKENNIPFAIHAPHYAHELDFSNKDKESFNLNLVEQVKIYANTLNSCYTVFHPGIGGKIEETIRQMKLIRNLNFVVENKPYIVPMGEDKKDEFCVGATFEEIEKIITEVGCGFCLDIGHGMCCANYINENPYLYIKKLNSLNPTAYHISDNKFDSIYDAHKHLGAGNIDFEKIKQSINDDVYIAIETTKDSKENLDDFIGDAKCLKTFL